MAEERVYQLRDAGIYHALPVYGPSPAGLTAIVTGANGISGHHMVRVLGESPQRWSKIYCLSRRPPALPDGLPAAAEHIPLDFLQPAADIAAALRDRGVRADHVFFFSYIQVAPEPGSSLWSSAEAMSRVNTQLLSNFLDALPLAGIAPKTVVLQTGAKNYGLHLGHAALPQHESDPRVDLEPNFYYAQEDCLWDFCKRHAVAWTVCMPSFILGAVPDAAMNVVFPLAVYAAVTKHLGERLEYPGDLAAWETPQAQSSAALNAYMEEWCALTPAAHGEKFNTFDGSAFTWGKFWPLLAARYGVECGRPDPDAAYTEIKNAYDTPPRGFGPNPGARIRVSLTQWAQRADVQAAWKELAAEHDLLDKELRDVERIFSFADAALCWNQSVYFSEDKARKLGWHGHVDSAESIFEVLRDFERIKMVPPLPK